MDTPTELLERWGTDHHVDRVVIHWHRHGAMVGGAQFHSDRCPALPPSAGVPAAIATRWLATLEGGEILDIADVGALDDEWTAERTLLRSAGVGAALAVPVRDPAGRIVGSVAAHDLDPRRWTAAEAASLREVADSLQAVAGADARRASMVSLATFESLPLGLVVLDAQGGAIAANAAARTFGLRPGEDAQEGLAGVTDLGRESSARVRAAVAPIVAGRTTTGTANLTIFDIPVDVWFHRVTDEGPDAEILGVMLTAPEQSDLRTDVLALLQGGHVHAAYQPLLDIDGRLVGVEALCRPVDPVSGAVDPALFVSRAERCGAVGSLDRMMLRNAVLDRRLFETAGHPLVVSVNVGADTLLTGFARSAIGICEEAGVDPATMQLEVTETELLSDPRAIAELTALSRAGFRLALDDFGSGYSSFAYLANLPVDAVKLDRSLVVAGAADDRARRVAEGVCRLARDLDLAIYAEGVESTREHQLVMDLECVAWQGFLCSPAVAAHDLAMMMAMHVVDDGPPRLVAPHQVRVGH